MKVRIEKFKSAFTTNDDVDSIGEVFFENTKLNRVKGREYGIRVGIIGGSDYFLKRMSCPYKINPLLKSLALKPRSIEEETDGGLAELKDLLVKRRSRRQFVEEKLTFQQVSDLIYYSSGVTAVMKHHKTNEVMARFRAYPSGGGLFPIEVYPAVLNVEELEAGLYHYNVRHNRLETMKTYSSDVLAERIRSMCMDDPLLTNCCVVMFIACAFRRTNFKYNERGFRFCLIEAGHCCQNIYLLGEAMGLGVVSLGGFYDDEVNELLGIDGVNEAVVYPVVIGRIASETREKDQSSDSEVVERSSDSNLSYRSAASQLSCHDLDEED